MRTVSKALAALPLIALLAACGGGGGDTPAPAPAPAPAPQTDVERSEAVVSLLRASRALIHSNPTFFMTSTFPFGVATCQSGTRTGTADGVAFSAGTVAPMQLGGSGNLSLNFADCAYATARLDAVMNGSLSIAYAFPLAPPQTGAVVATGYRVVDRAQQNDHQLDGRIASSFTSSGLNPRTLTTTYTPAALTMLNRTNGRSASLTGGSFVDAVTDDGLGTISRVVSTYSGLTYVIAGRSVRLDGAIDSADRSASRIVVTVDGVEAARLAVSLSGNLVVTGSGNVPPL